MERARKLRENFIVVLVYGKFPHSCSSTKQPFLAGAAERSVSFGSGKILSLGVFVVWTRGGEKGESKTFACVREKERENTFMGKHFWPCLYGFSSLSLSLVCIQWKIKHNSKREHFSRLREFKRFRTPYFVSFASYIRKGILFDFFHSQPNVNVKNLSLRSTCKLVNKTKRIFLSVKFAKEKKSQEISSLLFSALGFCIKEEGKKERERKNRKNLFFSLVVYTLILSNIFYAHQCTSGSAFLCTYTANTNNTPKQGHTINKYT